MRPASHSRRGREPATGSAGAKRRGPRRRLAGVTIVPSQFIQTNTRLVPVPSLPAIRLYTAHEATGLWRLAEAEADGGDPPPYWAFPWAGGLALARYLVDRPETVTGRRVLDLGTGSGLVAIAAAMAGASVVTAADIDRYAIAAATLNAAANNVAVNVTGADLTCGPPPDVDLVAIGDLFYERDLATVVTGFLERCVKRSIDVLIGDPGRAYLPRTRLRLLREYRVPDVGEVESAATKPSAVFAFMATAPGGAPSPPG